MSLLAHEHFEKDGFRLRGVELARIDAFSDVVFGFALTLLVVSLEVPKTYAELHDSLRGFFPFAICFTFLMMVWYAHYKFFRRFGTHDFGTIVINAVLLFVVLFYVYPTKFLFTLFVFSLAGIPQHVFTDIHQMTSLMILFCLGFAGVYFLLGALYWNAWRQREALALTPVERFLAKSYIVEALGVAVIGLIACAITLTLPPRYAGTAGSAFVLIWPFKIIYGRLTRKHVQQLRDPKRKLPRH